MHWTINYDYSGIIFGYANCKEKNGEILRTIYNLNDSLSLGLVNEVANSDLVTNDRKCYC